MKIIKRGTGKRTHICTQNWPTNDTIGTIAECEDCGKRWILRDVKLTSTWSYPLWRRTGIFQNRKK